MKIKYLFLFFLLFLIGCNGKTTEIAITTATTTATTNTFSTTETESFELEFRVNEGMLQWKYVTDDSWNDIYSLDNFNGLGISEVIINAEGELVITYTDSTSVNLGKFNQFHLVQFLDGSGRVISVQLVRDGEAAIEPVIPSLVGHYFAGWDKEFDEVREDLVIVPYFFYESYTAYLNENGGSEVGNYGTDYGIPIELPVPERPGYIFLGWFYGLDANSEKLVNGTALTSDVTVYAHWQKTNIINVTNEEEFLAALEDVSYEQIFFANDIEIYNSININRPITLVGNGYSLRYKATDELFNIETNGAYSSSEFMYPNNSFLKIYDLDIVINHGINGYYASVIIDVFRTNNFQVILDNVNIVGDVNYAIKVTESDEFKLDINNCTIDVRNNALYLENGEYLNINLTNTVITSNFPIYLYEVFNSYLNLKFTDITSKKIATPNSSIAVDGGGSNDIDITNCNISTLNEDYASQAIRINDFFGTNKFRLKTVNIESFSNTYSGVIYDVYENTLFDAFEVKLKIKEGISSIPNQGFSLNNVISQIELPNTLTSIGHNAFSNCDMLQSVVIPEGVISIGDYAFANNDKLISLYMPATVSYVGVEAFARNNLDFTLYIEEGIDMSSFLGDWDFEVPIKETDVQGINIMNGIVYLGLSNDEVIVLNYLFSDDSNRYIFPMVEIDGVYMDVKEIAPYAFYSNYSLQSVYIPDTIREISKQAFAYSFNLELVDIASNSSLRKIAMKAFMNCISLNNIVLPDSLEYLEQEAFAYNTSLESFEFGENPQIQTIEEKTFFYNTRLTEITIPDTVTIIKNSAFSGCIKMRNVYFNNLSQLNHIGPYAFYYNLSLESFNLPDSVTVIDDYAFFDTINILYFNISNESNLTTIGSHAFAYNTNLLEINLPDTVTTINQSAFIDCDSLIAFYIPLGITEISSSLFYNCNSLQMVYFKDGSVILTIGDSAFEATSSLMYINLPDTVITIGNRAFALAKALEVITIPANVISIGDYAFVGCSMLEEVVFNNIDNLTSIGNGAFSYCESLIEIYLPLNVVTLGYEVFTNDSSLVIYVEAESKPEGWDIDWNVGGGTVVWGYVV